MNIHIVHSDIVCNVGHFDSGMALKMLQGFPIVTHAGTFGAAPLFFLVECSEA